jgi:hypothetical protein
MTSDSSVVQAAWAYHRQIGGHAKGNVPVEVAAFIAGALREAKSGNCSEIKL